MNFLNLTGLKGALYRNGLRRRVADQGRFSAIASPRQVLKSIKYILKQSYLSLVGSIFEISSATYVPRFFVRAVSKSSGDK